MDAAPLDATKIDSEAMVIADEVARLLAFHMVRVGKQQSCLRTRIAVHDAIRERMPSILDLVLLPTEVNDAIRP